MKTAQCTFIACFAFPALSCSDSAVPSTIADAGVMDAGIADADLCQCPSGESLTRERILHGLRTELTNAGLGLLVECRDEDTILVTGGCTAGSAPGSIQMMNFGFVTGPEGEDWFMCRWSGWTDGSRLNFHTGYVCLDLLTGPQPPVDRPAWCECPPVEPLHERIVRAERTEALPVMGSLHTVASCQDGGKIIGGGCVVQPRLADQKIFVSQGGLVDDEWHCVWNNPSSDSTASATVVAVCLYPPSEGTAVEADPSEDRLVYVTQEEMLPAEGLLGFSVTCNPGDTLISGSCTLDNVEASNDEIRLYQHGATNSEVPRTWHCGWKNPTTATPKATAMAICLRPPGIPPLEPATL